jgi:hypothetical protein
MVCDVLFWRLARPNLRMECDLGFCVYGVLYFNGMFGILHFVGMPDFVLTFGMMDFCRFGPTKRQDTGWVHGVCQILIGR